MIVLRGLLQERYKDVLPVAARAGDATNVLRPAIPTAWKEADVADFSVSHGTPLFCKPYDAAARSPCEATT